ncbi:hypothetical protein AAWM_04108 [Aspergillus awamori]|uniref:Uncharacterized protein n=1 Tax=Aspergillus awamori TaxID=105351 RepID=A0A401KPK2_ASPAW|nr:hypothetical protein AAWM_04108 [Aspergillus awamori]GKZ57988.1 hypothetical protein AnigIFM49718_003793 [Aspergillus niger]
MSSSTASDSLSYNFQKACVDGNLQDVQRALTTGRLSAKDLDTGLRLATKQAHADIVAALFDAGVPMSPNAIGCLCGNDARQDPRVIRLYFDRGLKPSNCITSKGEPLLRCVYYQSLLAVIAGLNCEIYRFYSVDCARELLERGVDPNRCGPRKISPLSSSLDLVHEDNGATFDLLVQYGAKMNPGLLFDALVWSSDAAIKFRFLLSKGLDPTTTVSAEWGTPLHVAALFADKEVIRILLDLGADPDSRSYCTKFKNKSPAEVAKWKMRVSHEGSSMKGTYQSVIKLLESAQTGFSPLAMGGSEKSATENTTEPPAAKNWNTEEQPNIGVTGWPGSSVCRLESLKRPTTIQSTREREILEDGSVSSRTRSRTKDVS